MSPRCFACKSIALTLAVVLVMSFLPAPLMAQEAAGDACAQGTRDGENVETTLWFIVGCALGVTGWLIAYVVEPSAPTASLVGKDSTYTMQYLDCYKRAAKAKQSQAALTGCAVAMGLWLGFYAILIAGASSAD
jgi:hypothetical protein